MTRLALRAVAIAIAVAGLADPVITISRTPPARATILTAVAADRADEARVVRERVKAAAGGSLVFTERTSVGGRLACAVDDPCVVVADGAVDLAIPPDRTSATSLIRMASVAGPSVVAASTPVTQHTGAAGVMHVDLEGAEDSQAGAEITIRDGAAIVGSASVPSGARRIDVPWWPIAEGPRLLSVATADADAVDVAVDVSSDRVPVLVFEPRPSWASAFVRRALEADPRLDVDSRVRRGPTIASTPDRRSLDRAALVVVGAPDALTSSDVALLNQYVRVRGGTLVLLPDRAPTGPGAALLPGTWREQLRSTPDAVGPLHASERLIGDPARELDTVLGGSNRAPSLLMTPNGAGRTLISGAMDAWRYRAQDDDAFDRFWRSIAADAGRHSASMTIELSTPVATPAERIHIVVRWRSMDRPATATVRAVARCGHEDARPIRLWPTGEPGVFSGSLAAGAPGTCVIDAAIDDGPSASAAVVVARQPHRGAVATLGDVDKVVKSTGGNSATAEEAEQVGRSLISAILPRPLPTSVRPMQSPWWVLPFAAALGGEWWLRRRNGLR